MESISLTLLMIAEAGGGIIVPKLIEYGILGIATIVMAWTCKKFYGRIEILQDKLLENSNKNIEINEKVSNAINNSNAVLAELKGLLTEHVMDYKEHKND